LRLPDAPGIGEVPALAPATRKFLLDLVDKFSPPDAAAVKAIEARTNHDVKALEYWIKERAAATRSSRAASSSSILPALRKTSIISRTR